MGFKLMSVLMLQITLLVIGRGVSQEGSITKQQFFPKFAVKSIQSEDGDVIDCMDIYEQPAFNHPALRYHKIQMTPTYDPTVATGHENGTMEQTRNRTAKEFCVDATPQLWQKNGSCPEGTVPIRRMPNKGENKATPIDDHPKKKPSIFPHPNMDGKNANLLGMNHALVILHAEGFAYYGAKGDINVWNPSVERYNEYTTSQVALKSGPHNQYEAIESGLAVNPSVYGDRQTRLFTYWTVDGSVTTGCFDTTCPGFVQISKDIALGAAIPISNPNGLPSQMTILIFMDPKTSNWWVKYGDKVNMGYWRKELFKLLSHHAETVQWGGEVYSTRLGTHPHTATQMGSGQYPLWVGSSGYIGRMRVIENSGAPKFPEWVNTYADEYKCYDTLYRKEDAIVKDLEFYYGGPGRNYRCP